MAMTASLVIVESALPVDARSCFIACPPAASLDPFVQAASTLLPPRGGKSVCSLTSEGRRMRAVIVGAGMGGLMTALALRQSGVFASVAIYEQTRVPSTAGAGLNIPPNGARICRWLGVDLDGGNPKGPAGVIDGGRAAMLESNRQF